MTTAAKKVLGSLALAAAAFGGGAVAAPYLSGGARADQSIETRIQSRLPDERDYSFVALPTSQPPQGASLATGHYANSLRSGQVVLFQYRPFTLYACAAVPGYTDKGACAATDGKILLRVVRQNQIVTRYLIGTKSTADPATVAPGLFRSVRTYVSRARFTTAPGWIDSYAEAQLKALYY